MDRPYLASWAGRGPGKKQSGGKRLQAGINEGDPWLRGALGEVVWAITHTQANSLVAQYQRLVRRRGNYKAVVAVAQSVLVIICHVLRERQPYHDLGADDFDRLETARIERHYVRRLEQLGYTVTKLIPARLLPRRARYAVADLLTAPLARLWPRRRLLEHNFACACQETACLSDND